MATGVTPKRFYTFENQGGSSLLFTTADCSGNSMFAMLDYPPLGKRDGAILNSVGGYGMHRVEGLLATYTRPFSINS